MSFIHVFQRSVHLPAPAEHVYAWHVRPGALYRLIPPWVPVSVVTLPRISEGETGVLQLGKPFGIRMTSRISGVVHGRKFTDEQVRGPFSRYRHLHHFEPDISGSTLTDTVLYRLPMGKLGSMFLSAAHSYLDRMFTYRHAVTSADCALLSADSGTIAVTGAGGTIGKALIPMLSTQGYAVNTLKRGRREETGWSPDEGYCNPALLTGTRAVVHLAGEPVAGGIWTERKKRDVLESRLRSTRAIAQAAADATIPPEVLVCASATGYYGDCGSDVLTEESPKGHGFMSDVCAAWEEAARPAIDAGIRVVFLRFGVVLTPAGGMLKTVLPLFKAGLGFRLGSGEQYLSWVSIDDAITATLHTIRTRSLSGAVNVVAPTPISHSQFMTTLGDILKRNVPISLPAPVARAVLGERAEELLLASHRVLPAALKNSGYRFRTPDLERAIRHLTGTYRQVYSDGDFL